MQNAPSKPLITRDSQISRTPPKIKYNLNDEMDTVRHTKCMQVSEMLASIDRGFEISRVTKPFSTATLKFRNAPLIRLRCWTRLGNICENTRKLLRVSGFTSDLVGNVDYPPQITETIQREENSLYSKGDLKQKSE